MEIIIKKNKPKISEVYKTYWQFAGERQNIFFNRLKGNKKLTEDPIFLEYKFTNAYRASDRVSQYLIKNVIYGHDGSDQDTLFRILLFKTFNKIETWQFLERSIGAISLSNFEFDQYANILSHLMDNNISIYSGAYIMTSGRSTFGHRKKHKNHLKLIDLMMADDLLNKIRECKSLENLFNLLKKYPTIGNFLAYQYAIDINYSEITNFDEMDFVFPGPGAKDGIRKCFSHIGGYTESDIIKLVTDKQNEEFLKYGIDFKSLWGRDLQLIDCQNLFCEVDKYARVAHPNIQGVSKRSRIKQRFSPKNTAIEYWYPPKWGINEKIKS